MKKKYIILKFYFKNLIDYNYGFKCNMFYLLKRINFYIRSTVRDERLYDLFVVSVEKEETNTINLNDAIDTFSKFNNQRYPLILQKY